MSFKKCGMKFLKGFRQYRVKTSDQSEAIRKFLHSLDCPRALTVWILFKEKEHGQLANLEFNPLDYLLPSSVRDAYFATKLLSKYKGLTLGFDLDLAALDKFSKFEDLCKQTNARFRNLSSDPKFKGQIVWLHNAVIRKIDKLLGEFSCEDFFRMPDWGPGASTLIKRRDASSASKFQNETGITRDLYALISSGVFEVSYPHWHLHLESRSNYPTFEVGNRVITVPKDASANRVIAIEPGINLWFQKSVGDMIGRRLLRVGIDLRKQEINQRLARDGSKTGSVATVDLSSASDSVAYSVVEALLPPRWFTVLDICRTHYGRLNDELVRWEKFSSMGNGFTFQLESLIFYAIASCCAEMTGSDLTKVSAYGDDIIVPTGAFNLLLEALDFYGFRVNQKKSHFNSSFRESCGAHYVSGFDVKPVYLKDKLDRVESVYRFANAVRRLAHRQLNSMACDARFRPTFVHLVNLIPKALRLRIPESLGDGGFIGNFDECHPTRARRGFEGFRVTHLVARSKTATVDHTGYYLSRLWALSKPSRCGKDGIFPIELESPSRLSTIGYYLSLDTKSNQRNSVDLHAPEWTLAKSLVSGWSDLGPWI